MILEIHVISKYGNTLRIGIDVGFGIVQQGWNGKGILVRNELGEVAKGDVLIAKLHYKNGRLTTSPTTENRQYVYQGTVLSNYDGDTCRVSLELSFGLNWNGARGKGVVLRLADINAPERYHEGGLASKKRLAELVLGKQVMIQTFRDGMGLYKRYIAKLFVSGIEINHQMLVEGYASEYQKK